MGFVFYLIIIAIALVAFGHFWTTSREMDHIGFPDEEYRKFLGRKKGPAGSVREIPPPPDGKRDLEIEALLLKGNFKKAKGLLELRMEEARNAPVGSAAKIARVSHYMAILNESEHTF